MKPTLAIVIGTLCLFGPAAARGAEQPTTTENTTPGDTSKEGLVQCTMTFNLKGWSAFYKTSKGDGVITCENGETANVTIKAKGGGLTFGKSEVIDGKGNFTGARGIDELFGGYAQAEAHAGAGKSGSAQALTKGEVSLTLTGTGRGVDVGFAFGKFTIAKARDNDKDDDRRN